MTDGAGDERFGWCEVPVPELHRAGWEALTEAIARGGAPGRAEIVVVPSREDLARNVVTVAWTRAPVPTREGAPVVGDVVQVLGWIGVLVEVDASGERGTIRWDRTGGPLGSATTRGMPLMPLVDCRVRTDLRAVEGRDVWTRR